MGWHDEWGIPDGQLVRIIGPDYAGDRDDIGTIGQVSYARGGAEYWVRFLNGPSEGKGTTFPSTSLEPVEITASERERNLNEAADRYMAGEITAEKFEDVQRVNRRDLRPTCGGFLQKVDLSER